VFNAMSKDLPRTINDYYATVYLRRHHAGKRPESGERIDVHVRIPEQEANRLAGAGRRPEVMISEVYRRVASVAIETVGVPNVPWAITVISIADSSKPHSFPMASNFKNQAGAEGWILYSK
jgi:hypothetical protein